MTQLIHKGEDIGKLRIDEVMSHPVETISMDIPVYEAVRTMNQKRIRRLVIVDKNDKIAGLITQYDIAKKIRDEIYRIFKGYYT